MITRLALTLGVLGIIGGCIHMVDSVGRGVIIVGGSVIVTAIALYAIEAVRWHRDNKSRDVV